MERLKHARNNLARRKLRVRAKVAGTSIQPRLSVYISNQHVTAQIIDDSKGTTLVSASSIGSQAKGIKRTEQAAIIGADIAKKAKAAKIRKVVFDRNGRLYHGRIKALADAARAEGLEF